MRVLFTSPILEHPPAGGPQLRIENSIKALSTACDLDVISRSPGPREARERTAAFLASYSREFRFAPRLERDAPANHRISPIPGSAAKKRGKHKYRIHNERTRSVVVAD